MVAERLLDLRIPDFSSLFARAPSAMAATPIVEGFLRPPMMDYQPGTASVQDYIQMATMGAVAIEAVIIGGGRVVSGVYNWTTKKMQLLRDMNGNPVDFPALCDAPQLQLTNFEMERPTTPRQVPTTIAQQVNDDDNHNDNDDKAQQSMTDSGVASKGAFTQKLMLATKSVSIHSQSPHTLVAALFQESIDDSKENIKQTDDKTRAELDRMGKGKWEGKGNKGQEDVEDDNTRRKQRIHEYNTQECKDKVWESQRLWRTLTPITQMSPNASPSKDMRYVAETIEQWAHTFIAIGL